MLKNFQIFSMLGASSQDYKTTLRKCIRGVTYSASLLLCALSGSASADVVVGVPDEWYRNHPAATANVLIGYDMGEKYPSMACFCHNKTISDQGSIEGCNLKYPTSIHSPPVTVGEWLQKNKPGVSVGGFNGSSELGEAETVVTIKDIPKDKLDMDLAKFFNDHALIQVTGSKKVGYDIQVSFPY